MKTIAKWRYPEASERDLSRSLTSAMKELALRMKDNTNALRFDTTNEEINNAESDILSLAESLISSLVASLPLIALTVYKFNSKQFLSIAKKTGGAKNESVIILAALGPSASENWYGSLSSLWVEMCEVSIRKLFGNAISDWSVNVRGANFDGKSKSEVDDMLNKRFAVYNSWSSNRAVGMIGAWNTRLMKQRLYDAGVTAYFWRGIMDERERLSHVKLEGKRISLNAIHIFPGEEIGCRCWAIPDWDSLGVKE